MSGLRIIFMGTPDYILPVLTAIYESGHELVCIYTQPPRMKGRGQEIQRSATHIWADSKNIPVRTPVNFKNEKDVVEFQALKADIAIVAAYGMLLPQSVLDSPKHGCVNIHPSLLPRWRGTSPIQHTIWAGDAKAGVSVMKLVRQMDAGPLIEVRSIDTPPNIKYEELLAQFWAMGAEMIKEVLKSLAQTGAFTATPQSEDDVTYAKMLEKEDGRINWVKTAIETDRMVRALNPWPGTYCEFNGQRIKINEVMLAGQSTNHPPGTIIDRHGHIACGGNTVLQILKLQPEGKKPMDFASALNGGYVKMGEAFT